MSFWGQVAKVISGGMSIGEPRSNPYTLTIESVFGANAAAMHGGGVWVSEESALRNSAVLACVRLLSSALAGLPLHVFRHVGTGKERADDTAVARALAMPNERQSAYIWRQTMWQWVLTYGNAPNRIVWDRRGQVERLLPMEPWNVEYLEAETGDLVYRYWDPYARKMEIYGASEVLHVRGLTQDGRVGFGVIDSLMRDTVGLALTLQASAESFYANNARPGGVIETANKLSDEARARLKASWDAAHKGPEKAGGTAVLEQGYHYTPFPVTAEQSQFLESRQYSVLDICRAFGVPPHMIGDASKTSYASAEQNSLEFVTYTLLPWCTNFEQEIWNTLLVGDERRDLFARHNMTGLLRGDAKSRNEGYAIAIQNGWLNRNEPRSLEDMNESEGLDEFLVPLNMTTSKAMIAQAQQVIDGGGVQEAESAPAAPTPAARKTLIAESAENAKSAEKSKSKVRAPRKGRVWTATDICALVPEFRFEWGDDEHGFEARAEGDPDDDDDEEDELLTEEQTAARRERQSLFGTFETLWTDAAQRLVRREIADLRRKLASLGDDADAATVFGEWLVEFYRELQPKVPAYFEPVLKASARAATKSVQRETGKKVQTSALAEFVTAYLSNLAAAWVSSSQGQLEALLRDEAEPIDAVTGRIDEWEEKRAGKTGGGQSVDSINASTVATYAVAGIAAQLWASRGKSCKFCRRMHGRRVAVGAAFIQDGLIEAGGETLRVYGTRKHPGLHGGCDCTVVAA